MESKKKIRLIETSRYTGGGKLLKTKRLYYASITLPLLAALTPAEYEVSITNEVFEDIDFEEKVDIVGITSITSNIFRAYEVADKFRKRGIFVVMGGIHVSMLPEEAREHADTVFVGEAEETWVQFLDDFSNRRPKKIYQPQSPPPLSGLPVPDWSLIEKNRYLCFDIFTRYGMAGAYPVLTAKGCNFNCDYCSTRRFSGGAGYRPRPVRDVVNEIKTLGAKRVFFMDDNIFANYQRAKELFRALIPLNIHWGGQGVICAAEDLEMVKLARKSGCYFLVAGLESITPEVIQSIGLKNNKVGEYRRNINTFRREGIDLDVSMMFGFDEDRPSVFQNTCDFLIDAKVPFVSWLPLTPFPGTRFYDTLKEAGRLLNEKWWMEIKPQKENRIYTLLYTGTRLNDKEFCDEFYHQYKRFYSWKSIFKRLFTPPTIRKMVLLLINLSIKKKISRTATVVEH